MAHHHAPLSIPYRPTDTYDFSPFLLAPAVADLATKTGGLVVLNIPETHIPSPLAPNIAPSTLWDLKKFLCGEDDPISTIKEEDGRWKGHLEEELKKTFDFKSGIGEKLDGNGEEKKRSGDFFGKTRGTKQGKEIWESWKRAWDLWNNYYIEGRENAVWIRREYERLKIEHEEERTRRALARDGQHHHRGNPPGNSTAIRMVVPDGNPAVIVQPGGQPVAPVIIPMRTRTSATQPTDAVDGKMWQISSTLMRPLYSCTQTSHPTPTDVSIQVTTKQMGLKQKPNTTAIQKVKGDKVKIWREAPMYEERTLERIINLDDGSVIVDWTPGPIDFATLSPNQFYIRAGVQRKPEYRIITDHVHVDHQATDEQGKVVISRPLEEVQVTELWDTGTWRTLDKDESVPGEEVIAAEEITSVQETLKPIETLLLDRIDVHVWEEVDINAPPTTSVAASATAEIPIPAQTQAMLNLQSFRVSPRKSPRKRLQIPVSGRMHSPAHTLDSQSMDVSAMMPISLGVSATSTKENGVAPVLECMDSMPKKHARLRGGLMQPDDPEFLTNLDSNDSDEFIGEDATADQNTEDNVLQNLGEDVDIEDDDDVDDMGDNPDSIDLYSDDVDEPADPTDDAIQPDEPTVEGESGGFMPMKELPDYKDFILARQRYAAAQLNGGQDLAEVLEAQADDVLSNSVWRPRRVGERELKIDIDEDIEDFSANTSLHVDGGVDCGRSPYPILRSVVEYFRHEDSSYYKKRVWDQVRGTVFNMPTQPEYPDPLTEEEERAKKIFGDFYRDENHAAHFIRHNPDIFPLDIRRCDRINSITMQSKARPADFRSVVGKIVYPWDNQVRLYPNMPRNDPWYVTPEEEVKRDVPPRRYPPKQCHHNSGEILYCDDTLWKHEVDRDESFDSRYFVTNLHGGKLIINGQEIKKGQIAGPLPPFAIIETQGDQVSFWWGVGGREWGEGPAPIEFGDYSAQWNSLRNQPGWEKVGLSAGQVWDIIIRDRLKRESTGDNLADDEKWERWKSTEAANDDNTGSRVNNDRKLLEPTFWNGEAKLPHKLYEVAQPECFKSEADELKWLVTRAEPLLEAANNPRRSAHSNVIIPDTAALWDGSEAWSMPEPQEITAQHAADEMWRATRRQILNRQRAFAQRLRQIITREKAAALQAQKAATAAAKRKRDIEDTVGRPNPKRVQLDVERQEKQATNQAEIAKNNYDKAKAKRQKYRGKWRTAVQEYQERKSKDARELASRLIGAATQGEVDRITREFNREKEKEREQTDQEIAAINAQNHAAGLSLIRHRLLIPDDVVQDFIKQADQNSKMAAALQRREAARLRADTIRYRQGPVFSQGVLIPTLATQAAVTVPAARESTTQQAAKDRLKAFQEMTTRRREAQRLQQQGDRDNELFVLTPFMPPTLQPRQGPFPANVATQASMSAVATSQVPLVNTFMSSLPDLKPQTTKPQTPQLQTTQTKPAQLQTTPAGNTTQNATVTPPLKLPKPTKKQAQADEIAALKIRAATLDLTIVQYLTLNTGFTNLYDYLENWWANLQLDEPGEFIDDGPIVDITTATTAAAITDNQTGKKTGFLIGSTNYLTAKDSAIWQTRIEGLPDPPSGNAPNLNGVRVNPWPAGVLI